VPSVNIVREHILRLAEMSRNMIRRELGEVEALSITFDGATTAARTGVIAVTAHWTRAKVNRTPLPHGVGSTIWSAGIKG
jgi:sorbitol-specific phosphotransferase system component IIA